MDALRNRRLIEKLTPVQLANELANNGYVNYHQVIVERNIDGKEFLNFNETKVQELKLLMNNVQVQLLWSYIQRIQKYPEEFHITNKPPTLPDRITTLADNKPPIESALKSDVRIKPAVSNFKPPMSTKPPIRYIKESADKLSSGKPEVPSKPQLPNTFTNQRTFHTKPPHPSFTSTTENISGNSSISEELLALKRTGSIQKRLNTLKNIPGQGNVPIFPNVIGKLPDTRNFSKNSRETDTNVFPQKILKPKPKHFKNTIETNEQLHSKPKQIFKPPIKLPPKLHTDTEVEINRDGIQNIDSHFDKKKIEIQNEIAMLHGGNSFKENLKSLQDHFHGLNQNEEEENQYRNWSDQSIQQDIQDEEVYGNWEADQTNVESFEDDNSDNWENSESWENTEDSDSDENQYVNHLDDSSWEESPKNDVPIPPPKDISSLLPPKPKVNNSKKLNFSGGLARPPTTLPDPITDVTELDDDKNPAVFIKKSVPLPGNEEDSPNLYEPGPVLDQSSELDALIKGPSLPPRGGGFIPTPQVRALPEIPVEILTITRREAENILNNKSIGTFIFRKSKEYFGAVTIKGATRCFNIPLRKDVRGFYFDTTNEKKFFKDLNELMQFYKLNDFKVGNTNIRLITLNVD